MKFSEIYDSGRQKPVFSVEVFPPKTKRGLHTLFEELKCIVRHKPAFVSVTYGAGGSTRESTLDLVREIRRRFGFETVPHLACYGTDPAEIDAYLERAISEGAKNIVALRGDKPRSNPDFVPHKDGCSHAIDLVRRIAAKTELDIAVAGYPEGHPECKDWNKDIQHLKEKVDAGAHLVLTQLFHDNEDFFRFRDAAEKSGIEVPIVPGLLPIVKFSQVQRITNLCGAKIPSRVTTTLLRYEDGSESQREAGLELAIEQARGLLESGVPGIHIFSLNNGRNTSKLVDALSDFFD
jgi:methylenetetrahydrofolate reductase (NADPH)